MGDNCPDKCKHVTFHFCMESGTHCDKHCVCRCRLCREETGLVAEEKKAKAAKKRKVK